MSSLISVLYECIENYLHYSQVKDTLVNYINGQLQLECCWICLAYFLDGASGYFACNTPLKIRKPKDSDLNCKFSKQWQLFLGPWNLTCIISMLLGNHMKECWMNTLFTVWNTVLWGNNSGLTIWSTPHCTTANIQMLQA